MANCVEGIGLSTPLHQEHHNRCYNITKLSSKPKPMQKKYIISIAIMILLVLVIGGFAVKYQKADAQTSGPYDLHGWAWSSNTGWISFNSGDIGAGGGPYKVYVLDDGEMIGYAWSANIGWIKFGGLSGFPGSGGNANLSVDTSSVSGWARACVGTVPGDCSSMTSRTDGWDGWIRLADFASGSFFPTGHLDGTKGLSIDKNTGDFKGYSWDSGVNGWINFAANMSTGAFVFCDNDCGIANSTTTNATSSNSNNNNPVNNVVNNSVPDYGSISIRLRPSSGTRGFSQLLRIPRGSSFDIAWNEETYPLCSTSHRSSTGANISDWSNWGTSSSGITTGLFTGNENPGTYTFTLNCSAADGSGAVATTSTLLITQSSILEI